MVAEEPARYKAGQIEELSQRIIDLYKQKSEGQKRHANDDRLIITIAGVPGSGKSTITEKVCSCLNKSLKSAILPQDGFHYYRHELAKFDNPSEAIERRGAPFTFNVESFLSIVSKLKDPQYSQVSISAPSFDHRLKDPVENDIVIPPDTKVVLIEGNYVSLKDPYWTELETIADEAWFVETLKEVVLGRIIKRHLEAGIAATEDEARERAQGSDQLNANYIIENSKQVDVVITN